MRYLTICKEISNSFLRTKDGWVQNTFTVTDKYRGKTTIQWGRPTIWLMNDDPEEVGHVDLNWLRAIVLSSI